VNPLVQTSGTIVNVLAVLAGSLAGLALRGRLPDRTVTVEGATRPARDMAREMIDVWWTGLRSRGGESDPSHARDAG